MGRPSQQLKTNGQRLRRRRLWKRSPRSPQPAVCGRRLTKRNKARPNRRRAKPSQQRGAATGETASRERAAIVAAEPQAPNREQAASNGLPELAETERIVRARTRLCRQCKGMFQLLLEPPRRQAGTVRNRRERRPSRAEAPAGKLVRRLEGRAARVELARRASRAPSHAGAGIRSATRARKDSVTARPRSTWWS